MNNTLKVAILTLGVILSIWLIDQLMEVVVYTENHLLARTIEITLFAVMIFVAITTFYKLKEWIEKNFSNK